MGERGKKPSRRKKRGKKRRLIPPLKTELNVGVEPMLSGKRKAAHTSSKKKKKRGVRLPSQGRKRSEMLEVGRVRADRSRESKGKVPEIL